MYTTTLEAIHHCQQEGRCINCGELFSDHNTHTESGWRETKISGLCEDCFDDVTFDMNLLEEPEDEGEPF